MFESSHVTFGGKWVWKPVCEMPEDDSVSLVLCYVGGTELHPVYLYIHPLRLHPMNIKVEEKRFSVVVSELSELQNHKYKNCT